VHTSVKGDEILAKRKEKLRSLLFTKNAYQWIALAFFIVLGYLIRIKPLAHLKDITTGKFIPLALDPFIFLRYAQEIVTTGSLSAVDALRYVPFGYTQIGEFGVLTHVIAGLYKFLHFFNSSMTLDLAHVLYPPIFFCLSLIFFYLLVRRLFDFRVGLLATAFLVVLPSYLYRTLAGFSDKESLAMFLMFAVMYFYVRAWQEKTMKRALVFAFISGVLSGLMGLTWGGVSSLFLIFGGFALVGLVLNIFSDKDFAVYSVWLVTTMLILKTFFGERYTLAILLLSVTSGLMFFAFLVGVVRHIIQKKDPWKVKQKIHNKIPLGIFSALVSGVLGIFLVTVIEGFQSVFGKISSVILNLLEPFGFTRWNLTVAESHQPYIADWIGQWGWMYMFLLLLGSVFVVYHLLKKTKIQLKGTIGYALFILAFIFSRFRAGTILDGVNTFSKTLYLGSLVLFILCGSILYWRSYRKDKELYQSVKYFNHNLIFLLLWFVVLTVAARGAIRLLHVYSPVTTILVAYAIVCIFDLIRKIEKKHLRIIGYFLLIFCLFMPTIQGSLTNLHARVNNQAAATGPSYGPQWQYAMQWVRENTDEDAVFAHWWDYGYWVQTGGQRATLTDGGNAGGYALNYFMGRHVITGQSEEEALEYLYARNATHLLMISDEIGKYPAFSSIGSDVDYDRYGWIPTYQLDLSRTQERRDDILFVYTGGTALDEDIVFNGVLLPKQQAAIGGFFVPVVLQEDGQAVIGQPTAIMVYNGQQYEVPLNCAFVEGKEYQFSDDGFDACLMIIPRINGDQQESLGSALYISPKIRKTLFTQLFLFDTHSEAFEPIYTVNSNLQNHPLMVYNGRLIGPLKIWELHYPDNLEPSEWYYGNELPDPRVADV